MKAHLILAALVALHAVAAAEEAPWVEGLVAQLGFGKVRRAQ